MTRPRIDYLLWFAWRDLIDRRGFKTTSVVALTVALTTALSVVAFLVPPLAERARLAQLSRDPLATTLWVWNDLGQKISATQRDNLKQRLSEKLGDRLVAAEGFYEFRYEFVAHPDAVDPDNQRRKGRTIDPANDPLAKSLKYREGTGPTVEKPLGIVVSQRLLKLLDYPEAEPIVGKTMSLRVPPSWESKPLTVLGLVEGPLPQGNLFLITPIQERELAIETDIPVRLVLAGPIPADWPNPADLPDSIRAKILDDLVDRFEVRPPRLRHFSDVPDVWEFLAKNQDSPPRISAWSDLLVGIHDLMAKSFPPSPGFRVPQYAKPPIAKPPDRVGYESMSVTVQDLGDLPLAATAIREEGLLVGDGVIPQMLAYAEAADAAKTVLEGILLAVWTIALVNVVVMQSLRLDPKRPELGLLRAIGTSAWWLQAIGLLQALVLWIVGTLAGLALAGIGLVIVGTIDATYTVDAGQLQSVRPGVLLFIGLNLLLCIISGILAIVWAGLESPAEAMSR